MENTVKQRANSRYKIKPQWKPGQSGNPNGRPPKVKYIPDILQKLGKEGIPDELKAKFERLPSILNSPDCLTALLRLVYIHALRGESWAVQFISERTEGKAVQPIDMNVEPPLTVVLHPASGQGKT